MGGGAGCDSMVELGWILEAGDHVPRQSPGCHLGGRELHAKAAWEHSLQRQGDPTKDKRLWLVLDGFV